MRELFQMWRNTRMVVLAAVSAAVFAAVLIPFKMFPLIPGTTELRPANALPVVFSLLFGPAGAWGSAMGNLIGDFFGTLGPGTLFGFVGNLLYGFLPYRLWQAWGGSDPVPRPAAGWWTRFVAVVMTTSACCALVIGWGLHLLGFVPFHYLAPIILVNNAGFSLVLSPLLLRAIHPRAAARGLRFGDLLGPGEASPARAPWAGSLLVAAGGLGGMLLGVHLGWRVPAGSVGLGLLPTLAMVAAGCFLI